MRKLLELSLILILCSCHNNISKVTSNDLIKIDNQGVNIDYTDSKIGDTTLLFIHGWGINKTYWINQVAHFEKKFRVITVDLPGFGNSGKNRKTWTVEDYTRDIHAVLTKLNLKNTILIGHSMSGSIIVETAIKHPSLVIGLVGVDNLKNTGVILTPQIEKEWAEFYSHARIDFQQTVSQDIKNLFSPSTDTLIKNRVSKDILSSDTAIAVDCLENLDKYPFATKLKLLNKPLCLINSDYQATYNTPLI